MASPGRDIPAEGPAAAKEPSSARADEMRRRLRRGDYEVDVERLAEALLPDLDALDDSSEP